MLAIQIPVMPVPVSEVAAAPRGCIRCGGVRPAPLAAVALAADGPGPAAELAALQAQLAALKAAVGAAVRTREPPRPVKSINARVTVTPVRHTHSERKFKVALCSPSQSRGGNNSHRHRNKKKAVQNCSEWAQPHHKPAARSA